MVISVNRPKEHPSRFQWPPELAKLLGQIPDRELAKKAGVSEGTVTRERKRRGIPPVDLLGLQLNGHQR